MPDLQTNRVLVTGGSGFIGTNLVQRLSEMKYEVVNVDIAAPRNKAQHEVWHKASVMDLDEMSRLIGEFNPEYVIHAAAKTDLSGSSVSDYRVNTTGTANLIAAMSSTNSLRRTIFISSILVCRNGYTPKDEFEFVPDTPYGESKAEMERIVRDRMAAIQTEYVIVRPTSIWGPWFKEPYRDFFRAIQRGVYVHPGKIPVRKHFGFVGNAVGQILKLMSCDAKECASKMFNVGDYTEYVVRDWANMIQQEMRAREIRTAPLEILKIAALVGDALTAFGLKGIPLTSFRLGNMLRDNHLPFGELESICGKPEYSLEDGVRATVAWMRERKA